jgi:hypothetical protein
MELSRQRNNSTNEQRGYKSSYLSEQERLIVIQGEVINVRKEIFGCDDVVKRLL